MVIYRDYNSLTSDILLINMDKCFDYLKGSSTKLSDNNFFHPQNNLNLCGYTLCICLFNLKIKGIACTIHDYDIRK